MPYTTEWRIGWKRVSISIHVEATGEVVMIIIADDGSGMDGETLEALNRKINGFSDDNWQRAGQKIGCRRAS